MSKRRGRSESTDSEDKENDLNKRLKRLEELLLRNDKKKGKKRRSKSRLKSWLIFPFLLAKMMRKTLMRYFERDINCVTLRKTFIMVARLGSNPFARVLLGPGDVLHDNGHPYRL